MCEITLLRGLKNFLLAQDIFKVAYGASCVYTEVSQL